ncbi:MAG TPA: hypothetical protein DCS93_01950 [Microscillaceae bacterium]|nr:hypothetical protein [Microscillaceae bacterium]
MNTENKISKDNNILVTLPYEGDHADELQYLVENFCGIVVNDFSVIQGTTQKQVYVCGDLAQLTSQENTLYVIEELSYNYENLAKERHKVHVIALGQVPIVVHNAGVYYRHFFNDGDDYFNQIKTEHVFQHLTESTKQSKALRKGIYLTEVSKQATAENQEALHYYLLRCSSNLTGPTDNFRTTDQKIMSALNEAAAQVFEQETTLNHVLAQIYENKKNVGPKGKEKKAKITAHSDKTKDMPKEGLIVFCTFYDQANFDQLKPSETDRYDWCHKHKSGLTSLHFKLKGSVEDTSLVKEFSVTLYPNSVFFIPLSTNRLYTHAIRPSLLNVDRIPTRMGYVVRCSKTEALFIDDQAYIKENEELVRLEPMTHETLGDLRTSYFKENTTKDQVEYGKVHFSMNSGDYLKPIY